MKVRVMFEADAAFCAQTGLAGWGAWAKFDDRTWRVRGGLLPGYYLTDSDAQLAAFVEGVRFVRSLGWIGRWGRAALALNDCERALSLVLREVPDARERARRDGSSMALCVVAPTASERRSLDALAELIADSPMRLVVRHVRGDRPGSITVGRACAIFARQALAEPRERRLAVMAAAA